MFPEIPDVPDIPDDPVIRWIDKSAIGNLVENERLPSTRYIRSGTAMASHPMAGELITNRCHKVARKVHNMDSALTAVTKHVEYWNDQQRSSWVKLFSPEMVFEDPVGTPPKIGIDAVHKSWDRSFTDGRRWTLHPEKIISVGSEAAVLMVNKGDLQGRHVEISSIETFTVDESGLIVHIRSFFHQPDDFALSPYFTPQRTESDS